MEDFKKQFGLKPRIGTKDEVADIAVHLALGAYTDSISFSSSSKLSDNAHQLGMNKYLEINKEYFEQQIKGCLFVLDYAKYDIRIFTTYLQYLENPKENKVCVFQINFFKSKKEFIQMLDISGMFIDFDNEEDLIKKVKTGPLPKPTEASLVKTLNIDMEYDRNRDMSLTLEDICKQHSLAKSTYYRVKKWLALNPLIKLIEK